MRRALTNYWSPEQIAGRLRREAPQDKASISVRTISHWIESDEDRTHWESFLRRRGKRPFRRKNPGGIGAPIAERREVIEQPLPIGDFDGDTVLGAPSTGGMATVVDRKSRYTIVVEIHCKEADHVHEQIKERLKQLDAERRGSVTFDNGTEFAHCNRLEKHLGMNLYFAEPGCPQHRGAYVIRPTICETEVLTIFETPTPPQNT